ncbi:dTDP-4-dehydrorhamnose 3,5-epimerase [Adlercreutzia sp. ZJ473]|uniref:dTDP-4-dehydrorhamnose 3,5-epimerase n=1 Tax=Adlercreutzia sp. ZJ473 TaxID=2722822 RepID=UPI00155490A9|nr:dTDP-4-dehydrorhamnose 3,5-epimerase [Adlercreutzia sp. ZJ473]
MVRSDQMRCGNFVFSETTIQGVVVVEPIAYEDERGFFMETYKRPDFVKGGIEADFVQDNHSSSSKGVVRGLHFQKKHPQSKLVRVVLGEVFDVAVDLRPQSPTFGCWEGVILSAENRRQLYIPRGFAHGFMVLSDKAEFCYKCDDVYHPDDEGGLMWDDPDIGITWPNIEDAIILSEKDRSNGSMREFRSGRLGE